MSNPPPLGANKYFTCTLRRENERKSYEQLEIPAQDDLYWSRNGLTSLIPKAGDNSGNASYHSVQNLLFLCLLSRNVKYTELYITYCFYGCETWFLTNNLSRGNSVRIVSDYELDDRCSISGRSKGFFF